MKSSVSTSPSYLSPIPRLVLSLPDALEPILVVNFLLGPLLKTESCNSNVVFQFPSYFKSFLKLSFPPKFACSRQIIRSIRIRKSRKIFGFWSSFQGQNCASIMERKFKFSGWQSFHATDVISRSIRRIKSVH